jgi:hypothetical protein
VWLGLLAEPLNPAEDLHPVATPPPLFDVFGNGRYGLVNLTQNVIPNAAKESAPRDQIDFGLAQNAMRGLNLSHLKGGGLCVRDGRSLDCARDDLFFSVRDGAFLARGMRSRMCVKRGRNGLSVLSRCTRAAK